MLDVAGEWAVSNGRLYMWAPDGLSPEGRVWAAPNSNGVDADNSSNITLDGVRVFAARDGVSANTASSLHVLNSEIINSARDGIWASGSTGMLIDKTSVVNSRRSGIDGWYSVAGATVSNSTVTNTGTVGMPSTTDAGIFFGDGSGNRIDTASVTNSGYHGISVLHNRNTTVINSVVQAACVTLTDCAGIYTGARDKLPLNLHIESNKVSNVGGTEGIAIYLDDFANGVTVTKNTISNSTLGMVVHNGFDNVITYNTFATNKVKNLAFGQDSGNIHNNQVTHNTFKSTTNEYTFSLETGQNLKTFATYDYNTYTSTNPSNFGRLWDGSSPGVTLTYAAWKSYMGQDAHSTMNGAP
jgi:parallel beta-helix repeat protein